MFHTLPDDSWSYWYIYIYWSLWVIILNQVRFFLGQNRNYVIQLRLPLRGEAGAPETCRKQIEKDIPRTGGLIGFHPWSDEAVGITGITCHGFSRIEDSTCWPGWEATGCVGTSALEILRLASKGKGPGRDFWSMDVQNRELSWGSKFFRKSLVPVFTLTLTLILYVFNILNHFNPHATTDWHSFSGGLLPRCEWERILHAIGISATNGMSEKFISRFSSRMKKLSVLWSLRLHCYFCGSLS